MRQSVNSRLAVTVVTLFGVATVALVAIVGRTAPTAATVLVGAGAAILLVVLHYLHLSSRVALTREALETREMYYRTLTEIASDVVLVLDRDNRIIDMSRPLAISDPERVEALRKDPLSRVHPEDRDTLERLVEQSRANPGVLYTNELRLRPNGQRVPWIEVRYINLEDVPHIQGLVVNVRNITDRKEAEEALAHRALHDELTGLANRALLGNRIEHALGRLGRDGGEVAVVFLDIDEFKAVNQNVGQRGGDEVLKQIGRRLANAVRPGDTVARMNGDEFAILIDSVGDFPGSAGRALDRIRSSFSQPIEVEGTPLVVSCSTGVATTEVATTSSDELLRHADLALYHAKRQGRSKLVYWQPDLGEAVANRLQLETDLRQAVNGDQLVLHYQPLISLTTGQLLGFEALVRWNHPRRGMLPPLEFISIAEESGLIIEVGEWVLRTACETAAGWHRVSPDRSPLEISVNLSAAQLSDPDLEARVSSVLDDTGFDPSMLVLELTESVFVDRADQASEKLSRLAKHGLRLAIDDFGTGYSSLAYLQQFHVDIIKIDRAFTNTVDGPVVPPLIRGMIELGRSLDAVCVAEGIEHSQQVTALRDAGCQVGQGFLFSRPIEVDAASALVHGSRDLSRFINPGPGRARP